MPLSPHLTLGNDYLTPFYADQILPGDVKDQRAEWDHQLTEETNPHRARLGRLATAYFRQRADAANNDAAGLTEAARLLLDALGYPTGQPGGPADEPVTFHTETGMWDLPVRTLVKDGNGDPVLVAIATDTFTTDPQALLGDDMPLAAPGHPHADPTGTLDDAATPADAIAKVFAATNKPRFVLVCGGGSAALVDYHRYHDGKWLGVDLDGILGANDNRPGGDLDQFAYLFSIDATRPTDGTPLLDVAADASNKQAVGVSASLRDAVRSGVEAIANEVVHDMRYRQKTSVFGATDPADELDAVDLARQAIRWMYRLVVLLYAEARPGIGILPTDDPVYTAGYGLERLRDLALVDTRSPEALDGTHFQESLDLLFRLVNNGHTHKGTDEGFNFGDADTSHIGLEFDALRSRLFGPESCPLIDKAQLRDRVLQQVIAGLCYAPDDKGNGRQTVSYANLEINQLGAVYEGLMAYTGFFATAEKGLYEISARTKDDKADGVSRSADPSRGTWVIPVEEADGYPDNVFVTTTDPITGKTQRVRHRKGAFVFRLAGRDRKRSASFYTPSVLTEFTVRHAIDEWRAANPEATSADVLNLTVLEPALGSGAFANEAVDQLAKLYLDMRQAETGETVPTEDRQVEIRRLRAHFAINQTYGVDLNDTAVELAEVGLWLNAMHPGLAAPSLTARLRRGNSLIGARRATYTVDRAAKQPWKKVKGVGPLAPDYQHPHDTPFGAVTGIHHFLLPGEGWGAAAKTGKTIVRELAPDWADTVWKWRSKIHAKPTKTQIQRARSLAIAVERAWATAAAQVTRHLQAQNRPIDIWNPPDVFTPPKQGATSAVGETVGWLDRPTGAYRRLRRVMDDWCALWMIGPDDGTDLPTLDEWFDCIEHLIGSDAFGDGTLLAALPDTTDELAELPFGNGSIEDADQQWPWLKVCADIAGRKAAQFFHWDLDYAPVIAAGGFDLQAGNPPWVRPRWDEPEALSEHDPWWGITDLSKAKKAIRAARRDETLAVPAAAVGVASEGAENLGVNALLGAASREPDLEGVQTNLYMNFMTGVWLRTAPTGTIGLVHPESHFIDPKAGELRAAAYTRLRRHWGFINEDQLFEDVDHHTDFGVHVYGRTTGKVGFRQAVSILQPATVDGSMQHDGEGETPGVKFPTGGWDRRPHAARIVTITDGTLTDWVRLFDPPGTPARQSRLLRPLTTADVATLRALAEQPVRLADHTRHWTRGFDEDKLKSEGTGVWDTRTPDALNEVILQGPHILNATPFGQTCREIVRHNLDYDPIDLEALPANFIWRTNYQPAVNQAQYRTRAQKWDGEPFFDQVREAHREYVGAGSRRTLQAVLLPPGPAHVNAVVSIALPNPVATTALAGLMASLPYDYLIKTPGTTHINESAFDPLPVPDMPEGLATQLVHRTLRLNCLTEAYAAHWADLHRPDWDNTIRSTGRFLNPATAQWTTGTPALNAFDRWGLLCDLDAIAAVALGVTEDQLVAMYRSTFAVLRMYEHEMVFDSEGRQITKKHQAWTAKQQAFEDALKESNKKTGRGKQQDKLWDRVVAYLDGDTEVDLDYLVAPFRRADRELAMRTAFRYFAPLGGREDLIGSEPLGEWEVWG